MKPVFERKKRAALDSKAIQRTAGNQAVLEMLQKAERQYGVPMDDVRIHYNSDKPKAVQALAYTMGTDVYIGPGQEKHLKHELGHVVQQKLGKVKPTGEVNGLPLNTAPALEQAADKLL